MQGKKERKQDCEEGRGKKGGKEGKCKKAKYVRPHCPTAVPAIDSSSWTRLLGYFSVSWTIGQDSQEKENLKHGG